MFHRTYSSKTKINTEKSEVSELMGSKKDTMNPDKVLKMFVPIICAIFIALSSILYILYKSWSNKLYFEKWKDYEDCGV